jgi:hypothetical protein
VDSGHGVCFGLSKDIYYDVVMVNEVMAGVIRFSTHARWNFLVQVVHSITTAYDSPFYCTLLEKSVHNGLPDPEIQEVYSNSKPDCTACYFCSSLYVYLHKVMFMYPVQPEGRRPLGRPRRKWLDNIRMDLVEVGWSDVDWIGLAQDRNRWRALVNSILNLQGP